MERLEQLGLRVTPEKLARLDQLGIQVPLERLVQLVHRETLERLDRRVKLAILVQAVLLVKPELRDKQE